MSDYVWRLWLHKSSRSVTVRLAGVVKNISLLQPYRYMSLLHVPLRRFSR